MALIKCKECGREVSSAATACPGCAHPMAGAVHTKPHWTQDRNLGCLGFCVVFLLLPALWLFAKC